jgi:hypothetical protein
MTADAEFIAEHFRAWIENSIIPEILSVMIFIASHCEAL